jgi:hypothetical protein
MNIKKDQDYLAGKIKCASPEDQKMIMDAFEKAGFKVSSFKEGVQGRVNVNFLKLDVFDMVEDAIARAMKSLNDFDEDDLDVGHNGRWNLTVFRKSK